MSKLLTLSTAEPNHPMKETHCGGCNRDRLLNRKLCLPRKLPLDSNGRLTTSLLLTPKAKNLIKNGDEGVSIEVIELHRYCTPAQKVHLVRTGSFYSVSFQRCYMMKDCAGDCAESHRGLYWCNYYKRCCTLCFDLLATLPCNCTHIWKVHIGHSPLSILLQLNGWLCLAVKKWANLPALATCLIVPNLYFIKMMTHCTPRPLLTPVLLISNSLGLVENNKLSQHHRHSFFKHSPSIRHIIKRRDYTYT